MTRPITHPSAHESRAPRPDPLRSPWWLFPPSPLAAAVLGLISAIAPELRSALDIGYGGIAALFLALTFGTVTGAIAAGVSRRRIFRPLPMCAVGAGALGLAVAVNNVVPLIALMFVVGITVYAINARAQGDISFIEGANRARALGLFHVFGGIGAFLFPLFFALLIRIGVSWHGAFLLLAGSFVAYGIGARRWTHSGDPQGLGIAALRRVVHGQAGSALLVAVLGTGLQMGVVLWIPILMHDRFGLSTAVASVTAAVYMLALLVSRVASTLAVHRVSPRSLLVAGAAATVVGHVVLFAAPSAAVLLLAAILIGAGTGPLLPIGIARVAHWSEDDRLGTATVMALVGPAQIVIVSSVLAAHELGLSLQSAASVSIVGALLVLNAARSA